ncbi:MAG: DUF4398 domain-containing protein [Candidatus Binatia bacterium]
MNWIDETNRRIAQRRKARLCLWVAASLTFLYGCSMLEKPPTETLAQAEMGVRAAREARADELAPVDLRSAREKLEKSKEAMAAKRYDEARRLAESAQVDAELAEAKAEAVIVRRAAEEIRAKGDAPPTEAERESRKPPYLKIR